jgi:hypothetical protein
MRFLRAITGLCLLVFAILMNGFTLAWLWRWFVVPLDMPAIGVAHGVGLMTLGLLIVPRPYENDSKPLLMGCWHSILRASVLLALGWLVHFLV